ncbi:hypothetical protein MWN34_12380 [Ancylobacter sp. 6x-1]|uniref:Uncharacterized protein n=1 Tax=Ancylobacter crimeensis TaxID=2579147 RepID=A0ABT0DCM2_9HYPH|nr:hypothetical protein [Ancylobacter crimeensis]MCK0197711.1 hypothetical protein [Ancylobacter crimeensis]
MSTSMFDRARAARMDVIQSRRRGGYLPKGHPYSILPTWVPYPVAIFFMWIVDGTA